MEVPIIQFEKDPLINGVTGVIFTYLPGLDCPEGHTVLFVSALGLLPTVEREISKSGVGDKIESYVIFSPTEEPGRVWFVLDRSILTYQTFYEAYSTICGGKLSTLPAKERKRIGGIINLLEVKKALRLQNTERSFDVTVGDSRPKALFELKSLLQVDFNEVIYRSVLLLAFFVGLMRDGGLMGIGNSRGGVASIGEDLWDELKCYEIPPPLSQRAQ